MILIDEFTLYSRAEVKEMFNGVSNNTLLHNFPGLRLGNTTYYSGAAILAAFPLSLTDGPEMAQNEANGEQHADTQDEHATGEQEALERQQIIELLRKHNTQAGAYRALGKSPSWLTARIERYFINEYEWKGVDKRRR
jgi:transcriptional regulator with GAF, ATPase, and Fis domain